MNQNTVHFFVVITALSLFILWLFFLEGDKKRERERNGDKKMHGVPFHQKINNIKRYASLDRNNLCIFVRKRCDLFYYPSVSINLYFDANNTQFKKWRNIHHPNKKVCENLF